MTNVKGAHFTNKGLKFKMRDNDWLLRTKGRSIRLNRSGGGGGGGGVKNFRCMNFIYFFFFKPNRLQEFFSLCVNFVFRNHHLQDFFLDKFPLQEFFLGNCHPLSVFV